MLGLSAVMLCAILFAGCAIQKQTQYFAATDPDTGATNYYKLTISGSGGAGVDYHWQAGYFSAAAVDVLRGSMPDVPTLDLPVDQLEKYNAVADNVYGRLVSESKKYVCQESTAGKSETAPPNPPTTANSDTAADGATANDSASSPPTDGASNDSDDGNKTCISNCDDLTDDDFITLSRLLWLLSLSKSDLASIGMTGNLDPYQFRKLVFWTTASNIDLQDFAGEIDSVLKSAESIVEHSRQRAAAQKKSANNKKELLKTAIDLSSIEDEVKVTLKKLLGEEAGE